MSKYERFDCCYATILDKCSKGVFLLLDNDEKAYAKDFTTHKSGTKVLCTVLKSATEKFRTSVSIDSVVYDYQLAA